MKNNHHLEFEEFASDLLHSDEADYVELPIRSNIFLLVGISLGVILSVAAARVGWLAIVNGEGYSLRAEANVNTEKPIPANRGIITDKFGIVLAENTDTFSIYLRASELLKDRQQFTQVISQLSEETGVTTQQLEAVVAAADYERNTQVAVVRNVVPEVAIAVRGRSLPGVMVENDFRRSYPKGSFFSSVIGYTGQNESGSIVGKTGLESYYDDKLRGTDGVYMYRRDARGSTLDERLQSPAQSGLPITTTIDAELQEYFYHRMSEGLRVLGLTSGVGMAIDPRNGEVRALVNFPSYDNNLFVTPGVGKQRVALFNDKNLPLFNRAVSGAYNPGSTIKPLVAIAGLREGVIDSTTTIYSKGYIEIPNPYVPDRPAKFVEFNQKVLGWVDVRSALAKSSNVFFASVGGGFEKIKGLGIERLREYWQQFGLGQKTGIDLGPEIAGFLPSPAEKLERTRQSWRLGDSFNVSIGQGDLLVSPIQLLNYIALIANNGIAYKPHLVLKIGENAVRPEVSIDHSNWLAELSQAQRGMREGVVESYGTAHALSGLSIEVAAKTGSAQVQNNQKTNAFFVGYGPYKNPELVILVLVEDAKEGSLNAIPIGKDVFDWYHNQRIKN